MKSKIENGSDLAIQQSARAMLASFKPLPQWLAEKQPTPENARLGIALVREAMALAALTPAEECLVKKTLEVDEAMKLAEAKHVGA